MMEFLMQYKDMLIEGTYETLLMTFASTIFAYIIGLPLGVTMVITDAHGISLTKLLTRFWEQSLISAVRFLS